MEMMATGKIMIPSAMKLVIFLSATIHLIGSSFASGVQSEEELQQQNNDDIFIWQFQSSSSVADDGSAILEDDSEARKRLRPHKTSFANSYTYKDEPIIRSKKAKAGKGNKAGKAAKRGKATNAPTNAGAQAPTNSPSRAPSRSPVPPSSPPTSAPTSAPTSSPTNSPTTQSPTSSPSTAPTLSPMIPTTPPTSSPSKSPSGSPTGSPLLPLIPATSCLGLSSNYTCLQNQDFGSVDTTGYNIDLSLEVVNETYANAYVTARAKWMEAVIGDFAPSSTSGVILNDGCRVDHLPAIIDDLHICGRDIYIDGPNGILGRAGPLWIRSENGAGSITSIAGSMEFDTSDIGRLVEDGQWESVILHEMAHVIGIGTLWDDNNLINTNLTYLGNNAINVWTNDWNCTTDAPPVETDFGGGTRGGHWDEQCMDDELMTGFSEAAGVSQPLSRLTIASLDDMGYTVDYNAADPYDGGDTTCCSPGGTLVLKPKPPLSDAGKAAAVEYGRQILIERKNNLHLVGGGDKNDDDSIKYVGDESIVVLYEEDGRIYDVHVTA